VRVCDIVQSPKDFAQVWGVFHYFAVAAAERAVLFFPYRVDIIVLFKLKNENGSKGM
jgi:hypothetical protein